MSRTHSIAMAAYGAVIAVLVAVAAALGLFARGDGAFTTVTSVRSVTYDMATNGVYAFNARQVVAEGVGWDIFSLVVVVPALLIVMWFVARGSYRARLVALGLFGYVFYQYLEYAMTWAIGPLFPLFIVLIAGALAGLVWFGWSVAREGLVDRFGARFPHRAFGALNVTIALALGVMWSARIAAALRGDLVGAGIYGETTMVVQAIDLGLVVPTALFVSVLAWRRVPAGEVLAAAYGVWAVAMSAAIVAMLVTAGIVTGEMAWPPIVIFGLFAVFSAIVAVRIHRSLSVDRAPTHEASDLHRLAVRPAAG